MTTRPTRAFWGVLLGTSALALIMALTVLRGPLAPLAASEPAPAPTAAGVTPAPRAVEAPPTPLSTPPPPAGPPPAPVQVAAATAQPSNDERYKALHDAFKEGTPETARLLSDFARIGKPTPPEARALIAMRQGGASSEELVDYVRTSFPKDTLVRAVALRWLGVGAKPRRDAESAAPPPPDPGGGRLIRTDAH